MNTEVKHFIKQNIDLIKENAWEEVYQKQFPQGFTDTLLECGINPLDQGLNYIPNHFLSHSHIEKFTIPDHIASIRTAAFDGCKSLTNIEIPDRVTSIGDAAFYECSNLTSITIPAGVTNIEPAVFAYCTSLASIKIPNNVTSIEDWAF